MKVSVWTSWNTRAKEHDDGKPKCIFDGLVTTIPRAGDYVVVRDGFGAELVNSVIYDFVKGEIEITITGTDPNNEYGPNVKLTGSTLLRRPN